MADLMKELEELCEKATVSIAKANQKLATDTNALSVSDVDYLDKLTHMVKSIKTTLSMDEYEDDYNNWRDNYSGMAYRDRGMSNVRGRGRNAPRDSMGRFTSRRDNYSYHDGKENMIDRLNEIMYDAPDERTRQEVQRLIDKMQSM